MLGGIGTQRSSQTSTCTRQLRQVAALEQQVRAERDVLAEQCYPSSDRLARGAELAFLVVLEVLGQVALGHHAEDSPAVDHHGRVEQAALGLERRPDDDHRLQRGALGDERLDRLEHRVGQRLLVEQVVDRVPREPELGEDHQRGVRLGRLSRRAPRVRCALNAGSAIRTLGTAAAMRTNPWL